MLYQPHFTNLGVSIAPGLYLSHCPAQWDTCRSRGVRLVFTVRRIIARPGWSTVMYWLRRGRQLAERKEPLWRAGHPPHSRTRFFCNEQSDKKAKPNTNKPTPFYSSAFCFLQAVLTRTRIYERFLVYVSICDLFKSF